MRLPTLSFIFVNKDEQDKTSNLFTYGLKEHYEFDEEENFSVQPQESHFEIYNMVKHSSGLQVEHVGNDGDNNKPCLLSGLSFSELMKRAHAFGTTDLSQICQDFQDDCIDEWEVLSEQGWDDISLLYAIKRIPQLVEYCDNHMLFFTLVYKSLSDPACNIEHSTPRHLLLSKLCGTTFTRGDIKRLRQISLSDYSINEIFKAIVFFLKYPDVFKAFKRHCITPTIKDFYLVGRLRDGIEKDHYKLALLDTKWMLSIGQLNKANRAKFLGHIDDCFEIINLIHGPNGKKFAATLISNLIRKKSLKPVTKIIDDYVKTNRLILEERLTLDDLEEPLPPPKFNPDGERIFALKNVNSLMELAQNQSNCVFGYLPRIKAGSSSIYSYVSDEDGERGTLEIEHDEVEEPKIAQFLGLHNSNMSEQAHDYIKNWFEKCKADYKKTGT